MAPERLGPSGWSAVVDLRGVRVGVTVRPEGDRMSGLRRLRIDDPPPHDPPDLVVRTTLGTLLALRRGDSTPAEARRRDGLDVTDPDHVLGEFARLFGWD
jgi:hypothetical protein